MTHLDLAALFILIAIPMLAVAALWQLYIMLSETHTLNRYQKQPRQMLWIAITLFFTFSLSACIGIAPMPAKKACYSRY